MVGEPAGEFGDFAERGEAREGLQENVLDEIVDVGMGHAGEKDAVDHAGVAGVEKTEGGTIALLGGADEGVVGAAVTPEERSRPRNRSGKNGVQRVPPRCVHRDEKRLLGRRGEPDEC